MFQQEQGSQTRGDNYTHGGQQPPQQRSQERQPPQGQVPTNTRRQQTAPSENGVGRRDILKYGVGAVGVAGIGWFLFIGDESSPSDTMTPRDVARGYLNAATSGTTAEPDASPYDYIAEGYSGDVGVYVWQGVRYMNIESMSVSDLRETTPDRFQTERYFDTSWELRQVYVTYNGGEDYNIIVARTSNGWKVVDTNAAA